MLLLSGGVGQRDREPGGHALVSGDPVRVHAPLPDGRVVEVGRVFPYQVSITSCG